MYPMLTPAEIAAYNKVYDRSQFSSDEEWIRTGTGDPVVRCGVSSTTCHLEDPSNIRHRGRLSDLRASGIPKLGRTGTTNRTQRRESQESRDMLRRIG